MLTSAESPCRIGYQKSLLRLVQVCCVRRLPTPYKLVSPMQYWVNDKKSAEQQLDESELA